MLKSGAWRGEDGAKGRPRRGPGDKAEEGRDSWA